MIWIQGTPTMLVGVVAHRYQDNTCGVMIAECHNTPNGVRVLRLIKELLKNSIYVYTVLQFTLLNPHKSTNMLCSETQ